MKKHRRRTKHAEVPSLVDYSLIVVGLSFLSIATVDKMKIAIIHDYLNQYGGAERVLEVLLEMFPEADVYTLFFDKQVGGGRFAKREIRTSWLNWPIVWRRHRFFIPLMPLAARSLNLGSKYDLIISATAGYAKGIKYNHKTTKHICYCYTPLRYAWETGYLNLKIKNQKSKFWKLLLKPILHYLRRWDYKMAQRPDKIIAISNHIAEKIKKYYGREAEVVYPPVDTNYWNYELPARQALPVRHEGVSGGPGEAGGPARQALLGEAGGEIKPSNITLPKFCLKQNLIARSASNVMLLGKNYGYYLAGGRLIHYKNFDLIIKAFNQLNQPLKIFGNGPEFGRLKLLAKSNVEFLGKVSDDRLRDLYRNAKGFIFANIEDFGLVMAEAQSCGCPVIALKAGGALEIVKEGETGIFFHEPTKESLMGAVNKFAALEKASLAPLGREKIKFDRKSISLLAQRFSVQNFQEGLRNWTEI